MHPAPGPGHPECLDRLIVQRYRWTAVVEPAGVLCVPGSRFNLSSRDLLSRSLLAHTGVRLVGLPGSSWLLPGERGPCFAASAAARAARPPPCPTFSLSLRRLPTQRSPQGAGWRLGRYRTLLWMVGDSGFRCKSRRGCELE